MAQWENSALDSIVRTPHTSRTDNLDPNLPSANLALIQANDPLPAAVGTPAYGWSVSNAGGSFGNTPDANSLGGVDTTTRYNIGMSNNPYFNEGNWGAYYYIWWW